jgi:hypothetical protein
MEYSSLDGLVKTIVHAKAPPLKYSGIFDKNAKKKSFNIKKLTLRPLLAP